VEYDPRHYSQDGYRSNRPETFSTFVSAEPTQDLEARVHELEHQLATLRRALESREVIGIAKGILVATEGCAPDKAFEILRRASQRENRKLAEIAAELVASHAQRAMDSC
jgi:cell division septum initiation protein DivIVA